MLSSEFLPKTHELFLPLSRPNKPGTLASHFRLLKFGSDERGRVGGCRVVEKDSQRELEFEIDQDKAREALQQLDEELRSFSQKKIPSPKIRASDVKWAGDGMTRADDDVGQEFSGSFLSYATIGLFLFSFFYNLLFYTVIKPSVDGADSVSEIPVYNPPSEVTDSLRSSPQIMEAP